MNWYAKYIGLFFKGQKRVLTLAAEIAEELSGVSTMEWWSTVLMRNDKSFNRMTQLFLLNNESIEDRIVSIQNSYQSAKFGDEELRLQLVEEEKKILSIIPKGTALSKFLIGKGKSRYTFEDFKLFRYFDLWFGLKQFVFLSRNERRFESKNTPSDLIRNGLLQMRKYVDSGNSTFYKSLLEMRTSIETNETPDAETKLFPYGIEAIRKLQEFMESVVSVIGNEKDGESYKAAGPYMAMLYNVLSTSRKEEEDYYLGQLDLLFAYMNTDLLGVDPLKIVDIIRKHSLSTVIQKRYYSYCDEHSGLTLKFVFADITHSILNSDDFKWDGSKTTSCFNLPWNRYKIQKLYDSLSKSYIDRDTDVRDFCYALTGCKPTYSKEVRKVNWVHKEKQSLALLIGELRKRNSNRLKWSEIPNVFLLRGEEVSFHSSTQYNQALKSERYNDILNAIEEVEKYEVPIEQLL